MNEEIVKTIAGELKVTVKQVENTLSLLEEGNTVPFIARYRKEATTVWTRNRSCSSRNNMTTRTNCRNARKAF